MRQWYPDFPGILQEAGEGSWALIFDTSTSFWTHGPEGFYSEPFRWVTVNTVDPRYSQARVYAEDRK